MRWFCHAILLTFALTFSSAGQTTLLPVMTVGSSYGPVLRNNLAVSGQSFSTAVRLQTTSQPAHTYDAGFVLPISAPVKKDDVIAGELWLRRIAPAGLDAFATFNFEKSSANFDKSSSLTLVAGSGNWERFRVAFKSIADYAAGGAQVSLHIGFPPQTVEVGGLVLTNFGKTVALTNFPIDFSYPGRGPDAPWRAPALARIEELRKANLKLTVTDQAGQPAPGAAVTVRMKRHAFGFGSAVDGSRLLGRIGSASDRDKYRGVITNWFNKVVLENDLKWPVWEQPGGVNRATNALKWLAENGLAVRGHNLIWPGTNESYFLPADVPKLFSKPADLRLRINTHFTNILSLTSGRCAEWDVINEPYVNHKVMDILGKSEMIAWFNLAKKLAPNSVLYLNEYGNLERAGLNDPQTDDFYNELQYLKDGGAPIGGMGMQGHFGGFLPDPAKLLQMLDRFGALNLPIQATEFDVNLRDESAQADYLRDFMTALFSHPAVNGILMWGFWESQHWLPDAALFRQNWEIKPNGIMWSNLVLKQWWTTTNLVADAEGKATVRGFKGDYEVVVESGGATNTVSLSLLGDREKTIPVAVTSPTLGATIADAILTLTWPASSTGYQIEVSPTLAPAQWQPAPNPPILENNQWCFQATPPTEGTHFYRLRR